MLHMKYGFDEVTIKCAVVNPMLHTPAPFRATEHAAAFDLHFVSDTHIIVGAGEFCPLKTNLRFEIPPGYEMQIRPRSGLAVKSSQVAVFGTIDADYRGEVSVIMHNGSAEPYRYDSGMRVAQAVIAPIMPTRYVFVSEDALTETKRGTGGFGSTGTN